MARLKYTMLFEQASNISGTANNRRIGGWSESVYGEDGVTVPNLTTFGNLMTARANLLTTAAKIVGQRYQIVAPVGGANPGATQFPGAIPLNSDIPQMSVVMRVAAVAQPNAARVTLRGVPDDLVFQGEYRDTIGYTPLLFSYLGQLSNWRFKARNLTATQIRIQQIAANGTVTSLDPVTFAPGALVRVLRTVDEDGLFHGGLFRVGPTVTTDTFTLVGWPTVLTRDGRIRLEETIYPVHLDYTGGGAPPMPTPKVQTRKVGRPGGGYRGRQSKRR